MEWSKDRIRREAQRMKNGLHRVTLDLEADLYLALSRLAEYECRSKSMELRLLIRREALAKGMMPVVTPAPRLVRKSG